MSLNESIVEDAALEWFLLRHLLRQGYGGQEGYGGQVGELGYAVGHGPQLAPPACREGSGAGRGEPAAESACALPACARPRAGKHADRRDSFSEVVLMGRLREAIRRLNVSIPEEAREEALRKVLRVGTPALTQTNRAFHRMLRDGVPVEYSRPDGSIAGDHVRLVDFGDVRANDWLRSQESEIVGKWAEEKGFLAVFSW